MTTVPEILCDVEVQLTFTSSEEYCNVIAYLQMSHPGEYWWRHKAPYVAQGIAHSHKYA